MKADELKKRLAAARADGSRQFPKELRAQAIAYAEQACAAGCRLKEVARALGVDHGTVAWWLKRRTKETRRGKLSRVEVVSSSNTTAPVGPHLVLELPGGMRLTGLDVASAAALLRRLS